MTILQTIVASQSELLPLKGRTVALHTHAKNSTAALIDCLCGLGAEVLYAPIDYSSSHCEIERIHSTPATFFESAIALAEHISEVDIILEDGARLSSSLPDNTVFRPQLFAIEQTTSGIQWHDANTIRYPVVDVARSKVKTELENESAAPESVLGVLLSKCGYSLMGRCVLLIGYGHIGRGIASLARSHGALVSVVDTAYVPVMSARRSGFSAKAASELLGEIGDADFIISATSNVAGDSLGLEAFYLMKDDCCVLNAGSGRGEVSEEFLTPGEFSSNRGRVNVREDGDDIAVRIVKDDLKKRVRILAGAHPLNLRGGDGSPSDAIDAVFGLMVLAAVRGVDHLAKTVIEVAAADEEAIARLYLRGGNSQPTPALVRQGELTAGWRPYGSVTPVGDSGFSRNCSIARAVFNPGSGTDGHFHRTSEEVYVVEHGSIRVDIWQMSNEIGGVKSCTLEPGDFLSIPPGFAHRVRCVSHEACSALIVASPRFSFWDQFFPVSMPQALEHD